MPRSTLGRFLALNSMNSAAGGKWSRPNDVDTPQIRTVTFRTRQISFERSAAARTRFGDLNESYRQIPVDIPRLFDALSLFVLKADESKSSSESALLQT